MKTVESLAYLNHFTAPDEDAVLKNIISIYNYRGDGTQSDADRMRVALGEEAYGHYHYDTAACNRRVLIVIPRFKHPAAVESPFGFHFPAEWFWCFDQIEKNEAVTTACDGAIQTVPPELRDDLAAHLPDLQWMSIIRVNFFTHGRGKAKPGHRPPPAGVLFFKFAHGVGLAVATNNS